MTYESIDLLIDGDLLVYSCGFASDAGAKKEGEEHEPIEYCLGGVKKTIERMETEIWTRLVDHSPTSFSKETECNRHIYLTGNNNFRHEIAPDYKANRDGAHKPHWYKEIKEYLKDVHGAQTTDGFEADDAMGFNSTEAPSNTLPVICTKDKDLDMIPGWHYNWSKKRVEADETLYFIDEEEGLKLFYLQCLTGDSVDNIPGLFKVTGKKAMKKVKQPLMYMDDEVDMYNHVLKQYGEEHKEELHTIAKCLWISRYGREVWEPPV
jgi:5'-3' exonuclease